MHPIMVWRPDGGFSPAVSSYTVLSTLVNYAGTGYNWVVSGASVPTTGVTGSNTNSRFLAADLYAQQFATQYRVVGAGLRVRYTGTQLNMGGRLVMYRTRSNVPVYGTNDGNTSNITNLLFDNAFTTSPVTRNWQTVSFAPDSTSYLSYASYPTFATDPRSYNMLALIEGAVAGQSFEFETIVYYEVVGGRVPVSPSHADPVGYGAVISGQPIRVDPDVRSYSNAWLQGTLGALRESMSGYSATATSIVGSTMGAMATYGASRLAYNGIGRIRRGGRRNGGGQIDAV